MAPEQFRGEAVFASDLYSLGITVYQMLTGALPYQAPTPSDLDRLQRGELVRSPRLLNGAIPTALSDVVMQALAPKVANRYQRASEFIVDLERVRDGRRATPPPSAAPNAVPPRNGAPETSVSQIQGPRGASGTPAGGFCWHCRKPLHARADHCPFCGEAP